MVGYVYITTNNINNKRYIGQHRSCTFNPNYLGSGILINRAIQKYGKDSFNCEILQECSSFEELDVAEIYWINYFNADLSSDFYNLAKGGYGKEGLRGKNNGRYGKQVTKETRDKISKANKGKKRTPEQIEANRLAHLGIKQQLSAKNRKEKSIRFSGANNPNYGNHKPMFKMTDDIRQKISATKRARWSIDSQYNFGKICYTNPDTLESHYFIEGHQPGNWIKGNLSLCDKVNNKGANNPRARPLIALEDNTIFWGIQDVVNQYNISRSRVVKYIDKFNPIIQLTLVDAKELHETDPQSLRPLG